MCEKRGMAGRRIADRPRAADRIVPGAGAATLWRCGAVGVSRRRVGAAWLAALGALPAVPVGAAPPPADKPTLAAVDHAGLMAAVARQKGKIVVLDCWSTSCPPCVKEFPRLVALEEKYGDRVVCMSLSLDFDGLDPVDALVPPVLRFLQQVKAGGVINLIATEEADAMYEKLELDSVPAVYVWKADGSLSRRFDDGDAKTRLGRPFTYDDVEAEVAALLAR